MNGKLFGSVVLLLTLTSVTIAAAQAVPAMPTMPDMPQLPTSIASDPVVQKDFSLFQKSDIADKFGIAFHPFMKVCTGATSDEANCNARVVTDQKGTPNAAPKTVLGYGPAQFLKAYNLTGQASGHPIIAIVDAYDDPNIASDLATYSSTFGIPQLPNCSGAIASSGVACFKKVNQSGGTSYPSRNSGWALEISLDVEIAHATCQNCSILLVEANSSTYSNLMTAIDRAVALGAKVVSNSYGGGEWSGETSLDSHFNHPGVAFVASAGDSGYGVEYPAASRYVTAAGGTSLYLNADNSYNSEVAWSGTGSGCSAFEQKQPWQTDALCSKRTVADVSADADPNTGAAVYDSYAYYFQRGWFEVGGTSLSSPLVAAVYALSGNTSGSANQIPYTAAAGSLHDVTSGSNGSCGGTYLCAALSGYDGPTGLGSPAGTGAF